MQKLKKSERKNYSLKYLNHNKKFDMKFDVGQNDKADLNAALNDRFCDDEQSYLNPTKFSIIFTNKSFWIKHFQGEL